ncbi:hypothetical protein [Psychrobacillus sp. NPDC093180]|uniref:hypothetical protein n=1 Tax=Psychrobacillus sp. NPDC093180 TaxID=3364489 RepID=UPI003806D71A
MSERIDNNGKWLIKDNIEILVEPSQKWFDENPSVEPEPQPPSETELLTDYIVDVDYRVTMIELGI